MRAVFATRDYTEGAYLVLCTKRGMIKKTQLSSYDTILRDLGLVYVPVLMSVYILSLLMLFGYRITRANHLENVRRLSDQDA